MLFSGGRFISRGQEKRFRHYHGSLCVYGDLWCSAIIILGLTTVMPRMRYTGSPERMLPQAMLLAGIYVAHLLPPLVIWARGRHYYIQWREVFLLSSMALDWIALIKMRCWILMPDIQEKEKLKLAFQVYNMCTGHLVLISLGRNLPFKHHLVGNAALLCSALHALWRHCLGLGCKFAAAMRDFRVAADTLLLPLLWVLNLGHPSEEEMAHRLGIGLGEGPGLGNATAGPTEDVLLEGTCRENCFVVHGTAAVVVGFFIPLVVVFKREQLLRRRFLEDEARRARPRRQARALEALARLPSGDCAASWWPPGPVGLCLAGNTLVLYSLVISALCWAVQVLARGGMATLLGTLPDDCPGAAAAMR